MKRLSSILLLALCLALSSAQSGITFGCIVSSNPCSGNGICTKDSTCLCNTYYSGDSCQNVVSPANQVTIVQGGISQGALAGIIVGWILGVLAIVAILIILWIKKDSISGESNSNNENDIRGVVNTPMINIPERKPETAVEKTGVNKFLNINLTSSKMASERLNSSVSELKGRNQKYEQDPAPGKLVAVRNQNDSKPDSIKKQKSLTKESTLMMTGTAGLDSTAKNLNDAGEYAAELLERAQKYKMKAMNLIDVYSADSRNFVYQFDTTKDVAQQVAVKLMFDDDEDIIDPHSQSEKTSSQMI